MRRTCSNHGKELFRAAFDLLAVKVHFSMCCSSDETSLTETVSSSLELLSFLLKISKGFMRTKNKKTNVQRTWSIERQL